MITTIFERLKQGYRTQRFPPAQDTLPDRLQGLPAVEPDRCRTDCSQCIAACPTQAIGRNAAGRLSIDLGRCLFCGECEKACPSGAIRFSNGYRLATRKREDLLVSGNHGIRLAEALNRETLRLFGRSLKLRQVCAGGCNACEADTNVLNTLVFDLGRFGIQFVASPRHADGLLITGPVTENMREALLKTWEAVPAPRLVIAVGACAISGGPFIGHPEAHDGASNVIPVDLFVPGCPPHPWTILDGMLRLLGRV